MQKFIVLLCILIHAIFNIGQAQSNLSGTVYDENKIPMAGVLLQIEHTQYILSTDASGNFEFNNLKNGLTKIKCHYIGYADTTLEINLSHPTTIRIFLTPTPFLTEEVIVLSTRNSKNAGMSSTTLSKEEIAKLNTGQDLPYLLQLLPSAVVTSDAGNGVGYTGIRIRGSDATRVNVTINGIPLNDAESQGVYWVNLPDFASSTENIEVTRGAGVSTNGSGAFGGTINIQTQQLNDSGFLQTSNAYGAFQTLKNNISFGTGLLKNHFSMEGRLSKISSDGYIDRGASDLKSFYLSTAYRDQKNLIRLNVFSGKEVTYQSWNGVPESRLDGDVKAMQEYIIRNGLNEEDAANLLSSSRTYNYYTYKNQNDNYQQDHYQLLLSRNVGKSFIANIGLHATKGIGFFEEYKSAEDLAQYGIKIDGVPDSVITYSDLVRRRWLDNWFYGATWSLQGDIMEKCGITFGGAINQYKGNHFGEVIWSRIAGQSELTDKYYENEATKNDFNSFLKIDLAITATLSLYGDLQYRFVDYSFYGPNEFGTFLQQKVQHNFINPKAGLTYTGIKNMHFYFSTSVAQKEPNRADYIESSILSRPTSEKMVDYEAGMKWSTRIFKVGLNLYYMDYTNQLVLTGEVNDVGNFTRSNINKSFRSGIEAEAAIQLHRKWVLLGNVTFSENKIKSFKEFIDVYAADFTYQGQEEIVYNNTTISFSPSIIGSGALLFHPISEMEISFLGKYVSKQYLDNTESKESEMPAYFTGDVRASYKIVKANLPGIKFDLLLNNIFNSAYVSNGYTYGYRYDETRVRENFYYPQALFNIMGQVTLSF